MTTTDLDEHTTQYLRPPLAAPEPQPGCGVCDALARQRDRAAAVGNYSGVSDCNVELRNCTHRGEHTKT